MKKSYCALFLALFIGLYTTGQNTIELTFTAVDSAAYVQLDKIKVMNRTQGGETVLYWPDTVLVLDYQVGIPENNGVVECLQVTQNYPNPVVDQTTLSLFVPETDKVSMFITDILGRVLLKSDRVLDKGTHFFRFTPGSEKLYFFKAKWRDNSSTIKIFHSTSHTDGKISLENIGSDASSPQLKATKDIQELPFDLGDKLLCIGYIDDIESGIVDAPVEDKRYTFQFATNIPCLETPTVTYGGQGYNTIQIFSQCWIKENLNIGTMIQGSEEMSDNGEIEKYCYNDNVGNCINYGALYQWDEMMQYATQQGIQGICPPGWHLPTDEEWKLLEGAVDSQYGIGDNTWDDWTYRGFDAGSNLKSTAGWYLAGNGTDLFGFSGLPGGSRSSDGNFYNYISFGHWWSSSEGDNNINALMRYLYYNFSEIYRGNSLKESGLSVRCLKD